MKSARLAPLRFFSLLLLLPGLGGLIVSAMISTGYLERLPRVPVPEELRITPRNIHGTVVYQTQEEDRKLNLIEYSSVGIFLVGLGLGCVYMAKWGTIYAIGAEEEDFSPEKGR